MTERASTVAREASNGGSAALAAGVKLLGEYQGSGFTEPHYLIARPDGQVLHVSQLLFLVAAHLEAAHPNRPPRSGRSRSRRSRHRGRSERVAAAVSEEYGRTLSVEGLQFLIEERLRPMGVVAPQPASATSPDPSTPSPAPPRADALLALRLRRTLVPARQTRIVARRLAPLFHPVVVVVALAAVVGGDIWLVRTATLSAATAAALTTPVLLLGLLGVLLVSTLLHEFGHAAACHRGGAEPGAIGVAVYVVYPAFFTDVTTSYRLGRAGRLRTDLGGVYFNALTIGVLTALFAVTGYAPLMLAIVLVHVELLQQLMPIARLDGYFVVADLVGVPDLFGRVGPILAALVPGRPRVPGARAASHRTGGRHGVGLLAVPLMLGGAAWCCL